MRRAASPAPASPLDPMLRQIVELAIRLLGDGSFDEAASLRDSAGLLAPEHPATLFLAGMFHGIGGRRQAALDAFERSVAAGSDDPRCFVGIVLSELALGQAAAAAASCRDALASFPGDPALVALLGAMLRREGRTDEALAALGAASSADPNGDVHRELGFALLAAGRLDEAAATYRSGVERRDGIRHVVRAFPVRDTGSWAVEHGTPLEVIHPERVGHAFRPWFGAEPRACEPVEARLPEAYLAELSDAGVVGAEDAVITADGSALLDVVGRPDFERLDVTTPAMPYVDRRALLLDAPRAAQRLERGILLDGFGATNYFHWLAEFLPRLLLLEQGDVPADVPLLIGSAVTAIPQLMQALQAVDRSRRPVVPLLPGREYRVGTLYVPSRLGWLAGNLADRVPLAAADCVMAPEAIDFLRRRLAVTAVPGTRRLYVARRAMTTAPRLLREPEVRAVFEAAGFEVVFPEGLSFDEQRRLFGQAALVAGESGAGLANIVLAPPSATLICLLAEEMDMSVYADLTGVVGQRAVFIAGRPAGEYPPKRYQVPYVVEPAMLRARLDAMIPAAGLPAAGADAPSVAPSRPGRR